MAQHFLLSSKLRDFSFKDIDEMSKEEVLQLLADLRWGANGKQICPQCGEIENHYFRRQRSQWCCRGCGHCFSITSGTVFDRRRLSLRLILIAIHHYVCAAKGISSLELSRLLGVQQKTAAVFLGKLRELLIIHADRSPMGGIVHVDGGYFGGKPRKPRRRRKITANDVQEQLANGGKKLPPRDANARLNWRKRQKRRLVFTLRQLDFEGRKAIRTIVAVAKSENEGDALTLIQRYVVRGSTIMSDENGAYTKLSLHYDHRTVQHSVEYSTAEGVNENQAESYYSRIRRMEYGVTHRMTPMYQMDYAQETAWREDTRRCSTKEKIRDLFGKVRRQGLSRWWRGYWQGHHRGREILLPDLIALEEDSLS